MSLRHPGILLLAGVLTISVPLARGYSRAEFQTENRLSEAARWFQAGQYRRAADIYRRAYEEAAGAGRPALAARMLREFCHCRVAQHRYHEALQCLLQARRLLETASDAELTGTLETHIGWVYHQLGEEQAAVEWAARAVQDLSGTRSGWHIKALLLLASLHAGQNRSAAALECFGEAIAQADRIGDRELYAQSWNALGEEFLRRRHLPEAELALLEAYRVRKLDRSDALPDSYLNLGRLRMAQGAFPAAHILLNRAVELSRGAGTRQAWRLYAARGATHLAEGALPEALRDLRAAAILLRIWRRAAPPEDVSRVGRGAALRELFSARVETAMRLYRRTGRRALLREAWEAAEEDRAFGLYPLAAWASAGEPELPLEYWEVLARLQVEQIEALRAPRRGDKLRLRQVNAALTAVAGRSAAVLSDGAFGLRSAQARVPPDAVLFSFHLREPRSYLWAVTRGGVAVTLLPGGAALVRQIARFRQQVECGAEDAETAARALYGSLLGGLPASVLRQPRWLLALDEGLFDLPWGALVAGRENGRPVYLAERHSFQVILGAAAFGPAAAPDPRGWFVGVGDAVYNRADNRWPQPASSRFATILGLGGPWLPVAQTADGLPLPRLIGSGTEIRLCARTWNGPALLLTGAEASRANLEHALLRRPSILHLATHVRESPRGPLQSRIVLSLQPSGGQDLLGPGDIARWRIPNALVVLSGCSSGRVAVHPAAGLLGLARACLQSGAGAVVASRWETPDDSGALFQQWYRHLQQDPAAGPAGALRRACLAMLRSGTWRASPRYWAAFFVIENRM